MLLRGAGGIVRGVRPEAKATDRERIAEKEVGSDQSVEVTPDEYLEAFYNRTSIKLQGCVGISSQKKLNSPVYPSKP